MHIDFEILNDAFKNNLLVSLVSLVLVMIATYILTLRMNRIFNERSAGLSFLPAIVLVFLPVLAVSMEWMNTPAGIYNRVSIISLVFLLLGGVFIYIAGLREDQQKNSLFVRLTASVLAALLLVASGNYLNNLYGLFGIYEITDMVGIPLTVFLVVYIIHSFHFINQIDGMAGSLGIIPALGMGVLLLLNEDYPYSILAFSILGVLLTFQYFNLTRKKGILMGHTGALTLGYLLAFLAIHYTMQGAHNSQVSLSHPIVLAWSVLFVPLFDTFKVACTRLYHRKPFFGPDRSHIHHQLIDLGYTPKETTLILVTCGIVIILSNVIMKQNNMNVTIILLLNFVMSFLFNLDLSHQKKETGDEQKSQSPLDLPDSHLSEPY